MNSKKIPQIYVRYIRVKRFNQLMELTQKGIFIMLPLHKCQMKMLRYLLKCQNGKNKPRHRPLKMASKLIYNRRRQN